MGLAKPQYRVIKYGDARGINAVVQETIKHWWFFNKVRTWTCIPEEGFEDDMMFDAWVCRETGASIESHPAFGEALPAFYRANYNTRTAEESTCTTTSTPSGD